MRIAHSAGRAAAAAAGPAWRTAARAAMPATHTQRGLCSSIGLRLAPPAPSTPRPAAGHKVPLSASELIREHERARQEEEARARAAGDLGFREGWRRAEFWTSERRKNLKIMGWTWPVMVLSAVLLYRRMMGTDELAKQEEAEREKHLRLATATSRISRPGQDATIVDENAPKPLPIIFTKAEREALLKQRAAQQAAQKQQQQPSERTA